MNKTDKTLGLARKFRTLTEILGKQNITEVFHELIQSGKDAGPLFHQAEVKRRIMLGTYVLAAGYYDAYYLKAQKVRTLIKKDFDEAFKSCDAIITPTAPTTAFKIGEKTQDPLQMYLTDIFTLPASLAGLPALSLPCGFDSKGLPIGMQVIGKYFNESTILRIGYAFEQAIAGYDPLDSTSVKSPVLSYISSLSSGARGLRIGIPKEYFVSGMQPEVENAVKEGVSVLERSGIIVEEISLPHTEYAVAAYYIIAPAEASSNLARYDGMRYGYRSVAKDLTEVESKGHYRLCPSLRGHRRL